MEVNIGIECVGLGLRFDLRFGLELGIVGIRVSKVTGELGLGLG